MTAERYEPQPREADDQLAREIEEYEEYLQQFDDGEEFDEDE